MMGFLALVLGCLMLTYSCDGSMEEIVGELQRELQQLKMKSVSYETKIQDLESSALSSANEIKTPKQQINDIKDEGRSGTDELKRRFVLGANSLAEKPAFSASLTNHLTGLGNYQTIVFDNVFTNDLTGYSGLTGVFTAPMNGTYFFTATVMSHSGKYLETEICLNVTVLDKAFTDYNTYLEKLWEPKAVPNMSPIKVNYSEAQTLIDEVCDSMNDGISVIIDSGPLALSPILRSFARAQGIVLMSMVDEVYTNLTDVPDEPFISIQPPGTAMLNIISDIVQYYNLTNVAILYDDSFMLRYLPRRVMSGLLSHHMYREIKQEYIDDIIKSMDEMKIENVFIIASSYTVDLFLGMANGPFSDKDDINWFVITKDEHISCTKCYFRMRVVVAGGDFNFKEMNDYVHFMESIDKPFSTYQLKVDEAFAYDLVRMFDWANIPSVDKDTNCSMYDNITDDVINKNMEIMNIFQNKSLDGVYGQIVSNGYGIQQKVNMRIVREIYFDGKTEDSDVIGRWTEDKGIDIITEESLIQEKKKKQYKVVVLPEYPPFIYKEVARNGNGTKFVYRGLCIDLFDEIAKKLEFEYELYESDDGYFGSLNDDGTWNGAIHELIHEKADIAIGPISVMSERENVVDFTVPFHEPVGFTILMKKSKFKYSLDRFLKVLDAEVWGCIVASYFLFSILMWLFDKFSPFSYQNNPDRGSGPEKRIFTLKEGIWFCMTSLTPQGGGEAPKAVSGRLVAATWWLYGFLLVAFYTANLAAFLTVTRLETPISSLDDLSKQQSVKYGPVNGTSALIYFNRMKEIEEQFYKIWKDMSLNDSLSPVARAKLAVWDYPVSEQFTKLKSRMTVPNSTHQALTMVRKAEFALIADRSRNRYQVLTDCEVEEIGEEFSRKPFAFAVTQGSPLRAQISNVILELANNRRIEDLTNIWWDSNDLRQHCDRIENESDGISMKNIGGVFLVIAIGVGLSMIAFAFEYYYYKIKPQNEARLYSMKGNTNVSRIQSEVSLNDDHVNNRRNSGTSHHPTVNHDTHGAQNGKKCSKRSKTINHRKANLKSDPMNGTRTKSSNNTSAHTNGHIGNGVANTMFSLDICETVDDRYTDLSLNDDNIIHIEKL
ncbi:hypothetical protein ACF0H5_009188 [Mactra antiquata]